LVVGGDDHPGFRFYLNGAIAPMPASDIEVRNTGYWSMGQFSIRDVDQSIADIEAAFRTGASLSELRVRARAPIEELETQVFKAWESADDDRRSEILLSIKDMVRALQARAFYRAPPSSVTEAKSVHDGLLLRLRALIYHLDPDHAPPPDDF
jgi:hypothetical protein